MKKTAAKTLFHTARKAGILNLYNFTRGIFIGPKIAIVAYHRIDYVDHYPWSIESITPENFEQEMKYLRRHFNVISLDDLCNQLSNHNELPSNTAVITIDDGYKDVFINAYPILRKYDLPATVFLSTGYIGNGKLFWWENWP